MVDARRPASELGPAGTRPHPVHASTAACTGPPHPPSPAPACRGRPGAQLGPDNCALVVIIYKQSKEWVNFRLGDVQHHSSGFFY